LPDVLFRDRFQQTKRLREGSPKAGYSGGGSGGYELRSDGSGLRDPRPLDDALRAIRLSLRRSPNQIVKGDRLDDKKPPKWLALRPQRCCAQEARVTIGGFRLKNGVV